MSDDPFEKGFNDALTIESAGISIILGLLPIIIVGCIVVYAMKLCVVLGAVFGLGYGVYLFFRNNWLEVIDLKKKMEKWRNGKGKLREKVQLKDFREMANVVFLIVAYGYNSIFRKIQSWFSTRREDGYVHPGDDSPPILSFEFIKYLFGPYWLKGLWLLFRGIGPFFLVVCCIWGVWLSVGASCLGLALYSLACPVCRALLASFQGPKANG